MGAYVLCGPEVRRRPILEVPDLSRQHFQPVARYPVIDPAPLPARWRVQLDSYLFAASVHDRAFAFLRIHLVASVPVFVPLSPRTTEV